MPTKVIMPEMGEGVTDATIIQWLKKEGDQVEEYEPLVEVNTDKVDSELPSPVSGTVLKILYPADAVVEVNNVLAWIGEPGEEIPEDSEGDIVEPKPEPVSQPVSQPAAPTPTPVSAQPASPAPAAAAAAPQINGGLVVAVSPLAAKVAAEMGVDLSLVLGSGSGGLVTKQDVISFSQSGAPSATVPAAAVSGNGKRNTFISPVVARLSQEHQIDLTKVTGTGKDQRITKKDIQRVIDAGGQDPIAPALTPVSAAAAPVPKFDGPVPGTVVKHDAIRRSIAKHMLESKHTSPHVTSIMEADMSQVWAHRSANKAQFANDGAKLTFTAYFVSAVVTALKAYSIVNSSWSDEGIIVHKEFNVGMATALEGGGLIVPVIKNADSLSLLGIARAVNDLAGRARAKKLVPDEVRGGTFTITNHGTSGSLFATPIINQPQCGILGTGIIEKRAVVINDAIAIRPMAYLGLTFDHRILDGAVADYFLGTIKKTLEDWS